MTTTFDGPVKLSGTKEPEAEQNAVLSVSITAIQRREGRVVYLQCQKHTLLQTSEVDDVGQDVVCLIHWLQFEIQRITSVNPTS